MFNAMALGGVSPRGGGRGASCSVTSPGRAVGALHNPKLRPCCLARGSSHALSGQPHLHLVKNPKMAIVGFPQSLLLHACSERRPPCPLGGAVAGHRFGMFPFPNDTMTGGKLWDGTRSAVLHHLLVPCQKKQAARMSNKGQLEDGGPSTVGLHDPKLFQGGLGWVSGGIFSWSSTGSGGVPVPRGSPPTGEEPTEPWPGRDGKNFPLWLVIRSS